jgi:glutathione S-transferase
MKLYGSLISPFTRKAMVIVHELDLKVSLLPRPEDAAEFRRINPLGKIPALVLDDGSVLIDSPVICEYLNHVGGGKFFPGMSLWKENNGRWKAAGMHALADGIADAAVARMVETRQPTPNQAHIDRHMLAVEAGLNALERSKMADPPTIGEIAAGCALGYIDFRMPELDWRTSRPNLSVWYEKFSQFKSMLATQPK